MSAQFRLSHAEHAHVKGNGRAISHPKTPLTPLLWSHPESYHYPDFRIQRSVHYINGLQQYAQKFGLSLNIMLVILIHIEYE